MTHRNGMSLIMLRAITCLLLISTCSGFVGQNVNLSTRSFSSSSIFSSSTSHDQVSLEDLRSKPVKELKKALQDRRIPSNDLLEKEELVQRLYQALQNNPPPLETDPTKDSSTSVVIVAPIKLTALRDNVRVENLGDNGVFEPTDQPFATIELILQNPSSSSSNNQRLNLMVDTACSGVVLHSRAVQRLNLPQMSTPVTSMGASGSAEATGLTEIPPFTIVDDDDDDDTKVFSKLPAAIQNVDTLPSFIDGILGLSFLGQFHALEFDYTTNQLVLFETAQAAQKSLDENEESSQQIVARGPLHMLGSLGVYAVDVTLGGRGPVKMIVDTGGSNTFLSWKGVSDLGLSRSSPALARIPNPMGAMGTTAQVFALTHRIHVSSQLQLGRTTSNNSNDRSTEGLSLAGDKRLPIDIGDIPILQMMASQGVGGILGLDVFSRCKAIRLTLKGTQRELLLLQ